MPFTRTMFIKDIEEEFGFQVFDTPSYSMLPKKAQVKIRKYCRWSVKEASRKWRRRDHDLFHTSAPTVPSPSTSRRSSRLEFLQQVVVQSKGKQGNTSREEEDAEDSEETVVQELQDPNKDPEEKVESKAQEVANIMIEGFQSDEGNAQQEEEREFKGEGRLETGLRRSSRVTKPPTRLKDEQLQNQYPPGRVKGEALPLFPMKGFSTFFLTHLPPLLGSPQVGIDPDSRKKWEKEFDPVPLKSQWFTVESKVDSLLSDTFTTSTDVEEQRIPPIVQQGLQGFVYDILDTLPKFQALFKYAKDNVQIQRPAFKLTFNYYSGEEEKGGVNLHEDEAKTGAYVLLLSTQDDSKDRGLFVLEYLTRNKNKFKLYPVKLKSFEYVFLPARMGHKVLVTPGMPRLTASLFF